MNNYIIIHKSSDRKMTIGYDGTFGLFRELILSPANWTEQEIHNVLKLTNTLRTETAFLLRMEQKEPDYEFMPVPRDLTFKNFWDTYGHKVGKIPMTQKAWEKLSEAEKIDALLYIPRFRNIKKIDNTAMPYPSTYLNGKYWQAEKI